MPTEDRPRQADLPPPVTDVGLFGWLRQNLFPSWLNAGLTLAVLYLLYLAIPPILDWTIFNADWVGDSREACDWGGACWAFVRPRLGRFLSGICPAAGRWRVKPADRNSTRLHSRHSSPLRIL